MKAIISSLKYNGINFAYFLKAPVVYTSPSALRNILVNIDNIPYYIAPPLKKNNSKLKGIFIFDTLAMVTCDNNTDKSCYKNCYALKSQRRYPKTFNARLIHSYLVFNNLTLLKNIITNQINKANCNPKNQRGTIKTIRIQSSGDFYSQSYYDMWVEIAKSFPNISFYSYTGNNNIKFQKLTNFNVINSVCEDGGRNFGDENRLDTLKRLGYRICEATVNKSLKCGLHCSYCVSNDKVAFKQH
jgi:hypothetical protein